MARLFATTSRLCVMLVAALLMLLPVGCAVTEDGGSCCERLPGCFGKLKCCRCLWGDDKRPLHYLGDASLSHYEDVSTRIDYADVSEPLSPHLAGSQSPRQLGKLTDDDVQDIRLAEVLQLALANSDVIRRNGGVVDSFDAIQSVYDSAIQETQPLFGTGGSINARGVEDALADFDTQLTTSMLWGRSAEISNSFFNSGGLENGLTLTDESGDFSARFQKYLANSGVFALQNDWNYSGSNIPSRMFPSVYTGFVRAEYRQPLLAGSGTEFTRIAGPRDRRVGVNRGVLIARINQDITLADFEARVIDLLREVEEAYWDLYLSYQVFHNEVLARNSAIENWNRVASVNDTGFGPTGTQSAEAQARANYFDAKARVENALADLYVRETALRRLLGMPINDGKVLRPIDEPVIAEIDLDWQASLAEALTQRVELRQQKWRIKELQLALRAARNLARPTLDLISNYQVNGFGDHLLASTDKDEVGTGQGLGNALETLSQGEQTGWNLGVEFTWNMGLRSELAQVRNVELRLAKARAYLAAKELDIGHELSLAFQQMARSRTLARSHLNRAQAAYEQVERVKREEYLAERSNYAEGIDRKLRAVINARDARVAYFSSVIEYNKSLVAVEYSKGTLLAYNNVHLAEGMWTPDAYADAIRRAWARTHAIDAHHVSPQPPPISSDGFQELQWLSPDLEPSFDTVPPAPDEQTDPAGRPEVPPAPKPSPPSMSISAISVEDLTTTMESTLELESNAADSESPTDRPADPVVERSVRPGGQPLKHEWGGVNVPPAAVSP